jgi:ligand-binding sensor domain-containing protein
MPQFLFLSSKKNLCYITAFCLLTCTSIAQNPGNNFQNKYRAVHWGLDEGLSQGVTYHIIKDVNGFLWIGTENGLKPL